MVIYFPRGFHSGEAVRIIDGVTVVAGNLAKMKTDLLIVSTIRGPLGGIGGPMARQAKEVLTQAGPRVAAAVRSLPRESGAIHLVPRGKLASKQLGILDLEASPATAIERMRLVAQIVDCALITGAREIAVGPFDAGEAGARQTLDALRKGLPEAGDESEDRLRVILTLPDPRVFRAVVGQG